MANSNNPVLIILLIFAFIILIGLIVSYFRGRTQTVIESEFVSDPDDEYLKWVQKTRGTFMDLVVNTLGNAWLIEDEVLKTISVAQTDMDAYLINLAYENYYFRFYVDWKAHKLTFGLTYNHNDNHKTFRKVFKINKGAVNYEELYKYLVGLRHKLIGKIKPEEKVSLTKDIMEALISEVKTGYINGKPFSPKEFWEEWYEDILQNGASREDLAIFLSLTAAVFNKKDEEVTK